jgi:hypothetical protein
MIMQCGQHRSLVHLSPKVMKLVSQSLTSGYISKPNDPLSGDQQRVLFGWLVLRLTGLPHTRRLYQIWQTPVSVMALPS